jgi:hypothetical protein
MVKRLLPLVGGAKESAGTIACAWHVRLMPQHQMNRGQEVGGSLTSRSPAGGPGSRWPKPAGRRAEDQRAAPSHARRCFATWLRSRTAFARHCSGSAIAPTRLISTTVRGPTQRSSISGSNRARPCCSAARRVTDAVGQGFHEGDVALLKDVHTRRGSDVLRDRCATQRVASAPRPANARAIAAQIPLAPPVTRTYLPE